MVDRSRWIAKCDSSLPTMSPVSQRHDGHQLSKENSGGEEGSKKGGDQDGNQNGQDSNEDRNQEGSHQDGFAEEKGSQEEVVCRMNGQPC